MLKPANLVRSLEVVAHRREGLTRVIATVHRAVVHGAFVVNLGVLLEIRLVLKSTTKTLKAYYKCRGAKMTTFHFSGRTFKTFIQLGEM